MYLDSIGKVSTGIGALLDPFDKYGMAVPFYKEDGTRATSDEVFEEWKLVKSKNGPDGVPVGKWLNFNSFKDETKLRAKDEDVDNACLKAVAAKETACRSAFSGYD